jgi:hypothetical protein
MNKIELKKGSIKKRIEKIKNQIIITTIEGNDLTHVFNVIEKDKYELIDDFYWFINLYKKEGYKEWR